MEYAVAKKFKDYGFPQPEPATGQVWVNRDNIYYVIVFDKKPNFIYAYPDKSVDCDFETWQGFSSSSHYLYCPTPEDIMAEIARSFPRLLVTLRCVEVGKWMVEYCNLDTEGKDVEFGKTAIEALSTYYFSLFEPDEDF